MPANVESIAWFKETPWHGLGVQIEENQRFSIKDGINASGLDWQVELQPLYIERQPQTRQSGGPHPNYEDVSDFQQAVVRTKDGKILGTVGPRYTPLQNKNAFEWFQPLFDNRLCALNTAGSLSDGQKVWILADILGAKPIEVVKDDHVNRYLLLSNSHDGTTSVRVGFTAIRVVCCNTLAMAHNDAGSKLLRLRHSKGLQENLDRVREIINLANQEFEATAEQYKFLASKRIVHPNDLLEYVQLVLGVDPTKEVSTRTKNTIAEVTGKVYNGKGNDKPGVRGTWWAAFNGFTEWLNWVRGRTPNTRMDSVWFGDGLKDNEVALKEAIKKADKS